MQSMPAGDQRYTNKQNGGTTRKTAVLHTQVYKLRFSKFVIKEKSFFSHENDEMHHECC